MLKPFVVVIFTVIGSMFLSTVKPSSKHSNDDSNISLEKRMTEMEERLRKDFAEIMEVLRNHTSEIGAINAQLFDIQNSCSDPPIIQKGYPKIGEIKHGAVVSYACEAGSTLEGNGHMVCLFSEWTGVLPRCVDSLEPCACDPPSLRNGKVTNFNRSHGSSVVYECEKNFVLTGYSTVRCNSGKWEGHPPTCSYFDATFYASGSYMWTNIECHSDSNAHKIRFSRVVDTGTGEDLPTNTFPTTSEKSVYMYLGPLPRFNASDVIGAFRCGFTVEDGTADIIVPFQPANLFFRDPPEIASLGDDVTFNLLSLLPSLDVEWSRNGRRVPSWDGMREVFFESVTEKDAGVYSARYKGESIDRAIAYLSVRRCKANMYGERCDEVCPPCYNGGICHDLLGVCVCTQGFVGNNCEIQCAAGWYGASCKQECHCGNRYSCNSFTGACSGRCANGWKGLSCQIEVSSE